MVLKYNPLTNEISIDYSMLKELVEDSLATSKSLARKISNVRKQRQTEEFLTFRQFLVSNRKLASILARFYYKGNDLKILDENIPIMYKKEWIPSTPIDLTTIRLEMLSQKGFKFDKSIYAEENILPLREKRYSSLLSPESAKRIIDGIVMYDAPTYRLMEIESYGDSYLLKFGRDTYFNYIDTCELIALEFCKEIVKKVKNNDKFSVDSIKDKMKLKLRGQIDPFDFNNRCAGVGINTILILVNNKRLSSFYIHQRSAVKIAEAINTIHVVPAGTFQPRHKAYMSEDFSLYNNLMREFGEELLGQKEFEKMVQDRSNIFDIEILKKYSFLIEKNLGKVYYLGMGLDCLTTKPEILTALVFDKEAVDILLGGCNFEDNFEGEYQEVEFSEEALSMYIQDERILPAGAACLWLVRKNFKFFRDIFK